MNALVAHGGGPTSVINASLAGLVENSSGLERLFGARFGLDGVLAEDWLDLLDQPTELMRCVGDTPGSALGSSRRKLSDDDHQRLLDTFRRREIRCLFLTGGNGTMGAALEISSRAHQAGYELQVIGIPKTIDNDLQVTDHTPGYASTAHFFGAAARDIGEDNRALPSPICVLETLGRNAGWIVAATCFARKHPDDAPHLIYFPERRLSLDRIATDVEQVYRRWGRVVIAVCEGQLDQREQPFGADVDRPDAPGYRLASNLGHTLARLLSAKLGLRARAEKPGLFGRTHGEFVSAVDRREAWLCGAMAARAAMDGQSGCMVALRRERDQPYESSTFLTPLETVARTERLLPADWICPEGNDVLDGFVRYASPFLPEVQPYPRLR